MGEGIFKEGGVVKTDHQKALILKEVVQGQFHLLLLGAPLQKRKKKRFIRRDKHEGRENGGYVR